MSIRKVGKPGCGFSLAFGILIVTASPPSSAVTASFDLNGNGTLESSADSTAAATLGFVCAPCTITHSIYNGISDATYGFNWTGPGFVGTVGPAKTVSTAYQTYDAAVTGNGNVAWSNGVAGPADYYYPVKSAIIHYGGELISLLKRSPANITFDSKVEQIGESLFRYTNTVTNATSESAPFSWDAGGMNGTVGANSSMIRMYEAAQPAIEVYGAASFALSAFIAESSGGTLVVGSPQQFAMPAHALAPVPEPERYALFLAGLAVLGGWLRITRQRSR